ncbi:MAG: TAT-variant-translocated molybdopterin oxidoreductase [Phycisphaeraceae bacterium]
MTAHNRNNPPSAIRHSPSPPTGKTFWRSLDELADTAEFRRWLQREFPAGAFDRLEGVSRRQFLKAMAASFVLMGALPGCGNEQRQKIVPYVSEPAIVPGEALFYATTLTHVGFGMGVLAESHTGRPTKIEGNAAHPASLGATDVFRQAAVLTLYDPDRSQAVRRDGSVSTWNDFTGALRERLRRAEASDGRGVRLLTGRVTSPTLLAQIGELLDRLPGARWHRHEPTEDYGAEIAANVAFGRRVQPVYHFEHAARILSLDADFLFAMPGSVRYARDFADRRRVREGAGIDADRMNRLYVAEPGVSMTGANADNRLAVSARHVAAVAREVGEQLGVSVPARAEQRSPPQAVTRWARIVAEDLQAHRGEALVLAGPTQPAWVHALVHLINETLEAHGRAVASVEPFDVATAHTPGTLAELTEAMAAGEVETLLILDANPVYTAPYDLNFAAHLQRVRFTAHMGLYRDETARRCRWHAPLAHELETWSDARAYDGTASIVQPLIEPMYRGQSPHVLFATMLGEAVPDDREVVRAYWRQWFGEDDFEQWWHDVLRSGVVPGTEAAAVNVSVDRQAVEAAVARGLGESAMEPEENGALELTFAPDPTVWDGRYANNGWLQELPKSQTTLTWDNVATFAPATAERLGIESQRMVELTIGDRTLRAAAMLLPGQAENTVTLSLGYGREAAGSVGDGLGFNAYQLRHSEASWRRGGVRGRATGERYPLAAVQLHHTLEGRDMVRRGTIEQFRENPRAVAHEAEDSSALRLSLYPEYEYEGQQWGMSIDLTTCIGCSACTIACQAENNIPVVGKAQVRTGREMHWLRVDRYYEGARDAPAMLHQPVLCMHCEKAPCELVCPTAATKHSHDGLNEMVYNRCIGTRYCSNNCPYKVRRFNFYDYMDELSDTEQMVMNPQVSVRGLGVMEKCTYCVQRIRAAGIEARKENRSVRDGEVVTACQSVCPTNAITFGDINDPDTRVAQEKRQPHDYGMLAELNTQPRTTYLAGVTNPNPALAAVVNGEGG